MTKAMPSPWTTTAATLLLCAGLMAIMVPVGHATETEVEAGAGLGAGPSLYVDGEKSLSLSESALWGVIAGCFGAGAVFSIAFVLYWYVESFFLASSPHRIASIFSSSRPPCLTLA